MNMMNEYYTFVDDPSNTTTMTNEECLVDNDQMEAVMGGGHDNDICQVLEQESQGIYRASLAGDTADDLYLRPKSMKYAHAVPTALRRIILQPISPCC